MLGLSIPLQQHEGLKNDTDFQKISLLNYRSLHPSKNDICFLLFLRWSAVADSGMVPAALPSTPVPQHPKPKSKHRIEIFYEKPSIPVPQHRAGIFQHQIQKYCEYPSTLLPQHRRPKNDINFQNSQKNHKLVGFRGEGIKRAPASIQKQTLILLIHFFTSSAGAAAR